VVDVEARRDQYQGRIDEDAVAAYAMATNDPNPLYLEGVAVPPLFTATMILPAQWQSSRDSLIRPEITGTRGGVHGEHDVYFWGNATPGDTLQWDAALHSVRQTSGGVLVTQRILLSDLDGAPLIEHFWSNLMIGGTYDGAPLGPDLVDHRFPADGRARPVVGTRTVAVDRDQAWRYAGVSGDHAGHALDEAIARAEGYPTKILQGLCTFALCSGAVVDIVANGDPRRLRRLAGRFSAPAFPRRKMIVEVFDAGPTEEGGRALVFDAVQDGVAVIKHGRVELLPE
jgi:acyl dehydratase